MNIFEDKTSMPGFPDVVVKVSETSNETPPGFAKLPGEVKAPNLEVRNIPIRHRGFHY